jgi:hypothetical protein
VVRLVQAEGKSEEDIRAEALPAAAARNSSDGLIAVGERSAKPRDLTEREESRREVEGWLYHFNAIAASQRFKMMFHAFCSSITPSNIATRNPTANQSITGAKSRQIQRWKSTKGGSSPRGVVFGATAEMISSTWHSGSGVLDGHCEMSLQ